MRICLRGNFLPDLPDELKPSWSTESHLSGSFAALGHEVIEVQEDRVDWVTTIKACLDADLFVWVSTRDYAMRWDQTDAAEAIEVLNGLLPTCGIHLDLWHGLNREPLIAQDVYWRMDFYFTADGDHDDAWERAGIRHFFMPPAVFGPECVRGSFRADWASDVGFVGSWESYAHNEHWPARRQIIAYARERFGNAFVCWPRPGRGAVRGQNLNDLYASIRVVIGDSALAASSRAYHSDRVWETVGRGGFCVHPWIEGLAELLPEGMGVAYFPPGDMDAMGDLIERWRNDDDGRNAAIERGMDHIRAGHTYAHRLAAVLDTLKAEGALG